MSEYGRAPDFMRPWLDDQPPELPDQVIHDALARVRVAKRRRGSFLPRLAGAGTHATLSPSWLIAGILVLVIGGILLLAQPFATTGPGASGEPGTFSAAGSLADGRASHTATRLQDGRVLVVGGRGANSTPHGTLTSAEVWDPAAATFTRAGSLTEHRMHHSATLLRDGRVLIVGGRQSGDRWALTSAEVWDPTTATFSPAGSLEEGHARHTATLLPDGRVLIAGGIRGEQHTARTAEIWDPATATFEQDRALAGQGGQRATATLLQDGRVLVVSGGADDITPAGIWDPTTASYTLVGAPAKGLGAHTATLLTDGRILFVRQGDGDAEVWDPGSGEFSSAGTPAESRDGTHTASLLADGRVLVVGGLRWDGTFALPEIWDPATASFEPAGPLVWPRSGHTATPLTDGRVLIVGAPRWEEGPFTQAEVWDAGE